MQDLVKILSARLKAQNMMLVAAESCTGGRIASAITSLPGSSSVFDRGFVTYSNAAKHDCLGVPKSIFDVFGAVSIECAAAMAHGALNNSAADLAVAVTGIAGPDGGSIEKPIGHVCFGIACAGQDTKTFIVNFTGDRETIQNDATAHALQLLIDELS